MIKIKTTCFVLTSTFFCFSSMADAASEVKELLDLSLSDLTNVVTSVSKREESSFKSSAAIYVISSEDIRNSGATNIPEVLRMAPGLHVARIDSKSWAITSRGFNDGFGNKLLVLIDGRTVYTPLFSGVYWDVQDTFLEDVERIEIIRGPGATLWGANAVNGVINIVTKEASDTQSGVVNFLYGKETRNSVEGRYGGNINNNLFYRTYAKRSEIDSSRTATGGNGGNEWETNRSGFRIDWEKDSDNELTVQGDIYENQVDLDLYIPGGAFLDDNFEVNGGNVLAKWAHKHSATAKSTVQTYFDVATADYIFLDQNNYTYDLDYQYNQMFGNHEFVVGGGYRFITDELRGSELITYEHETRDRNLFSTFLQDTYHVIPDKLDFTFGSKFEHNDFTGFEVQPNARLAWYPTEHQTVWSSVSRAVRTPSRSEENISLVVAPGYVSWEGNEELRSEELIAYELGYRIKPYENILFDVVGFINDYDDLRTNEVGIANPRPGVVLGLPFDNKAEGETYGIEFVTKWNVKDYWTIDAAYTFLTVDMHSKGSNSAFAEQDEGTSAKNQFNIRSALYLPRDVEMSAGLYYVDEILAYSLDPYIRGDVRVAWKPTKNMELTAVAQNLFDKSHQEFTAPLHGVANEIESDYYLKLGVKF